MRKVVFIVESLAVGGAERALLDIVNNMDAGRFDVTVVSLYKWSVYQGYKDMLPASFRQGVRYRYLVNNHIRILYLLFNFLLNRAPSVVFRLFIGDRYDTVVAFYEGAPVRLVSRAALKRGKKVTWIQTSVSLSQRGKSPEEIRSEGNLYGEFDRIVALSRGAAQDFVGMFPSLKERMRVAYHPMDMSAILRKAEAPMELPEVRHPLLVSVGRMTWAKGYDRYLRVVRRLADKGYKFHVWIVGGGDSSPFERYCREASLDNVLFLGHKENPYPFIEAADWFVLPSYVEGFGTVSMEALALGRAVMATRCCGSEELLGDSEYGLVVENDEEALEEGLERILSDSALKAGYESTARERARLFDIEACIRTIEDCLYV